MLYLAVFNNGPNIVYSQRAHQLFQIVLERVCEPWRLTRARQRNSICVRILCHSPNHNQMLTNGDQKIKCEWMCSNDAIRYHCECTERWRERASIWIRNRKWKGHRDRRWGADGLNGCLEWESFVRISLKHCLQQTINLPKRKHYKCFFKQIICLSDGRQSSTENHGNAKCPDRYFRFAGIDGFWIKFCQKEIGVESSLSQSADHYTFWTVDWCDWCLHWCVPGIRTRKSLFAKSIFVSLLWCRECTKASISKRTNNQNSLLHFRYLSQRKTPSSSSAVPLSFSLFLDATQFQMHFTEWFGKSNKYRI